MDYLDTLDEELKIQLKRKEAQTEEIQRLRKGEMWVALGNAAVAQKITDEKINTLQWAKLAYLETKEEVVDTLKLFRDEINVCYNYPTLKEFIFLLVSNQANIDGDKVTLWPPDKDGKEQPEISTTLFSLWEEFCRGKIS